MADEKKKMAIDEDFLKNIVSQTDIMSVNRNVSVSETTIEPEAPIQPPPEEPVPKEQSKRNKNIPLEDYASLYLKSGELTSRQSTHISKNNHERILKVVKVLGKRGVSVGSFIDNVLNIHFEVFQDEINDLLKQHAKNYLSI